MTIANQHVSSPLNSSAAPIQVALTVSNTDTADGYSEKLDASISAVPHAVSNGGSVSGIAAGASNDTSLTIGVANTIAGAISGTGDITLSSDGTGVDGNSPLVIGTVAVPVSGHVYDYASPSLSTTLDFGIHHVGDIVSHTLTISNDGTATLFTEGLDATLDSASNSEITASGSFIDLAAGSSDTSHLVIGLNTASAAVDSATAVVTLTSDGSIDGLANTPLPSQTITVTGSVLNYATAELAKLSGSGTFSNTGTTLYTLDLGTLALHGAADTTDIGVLNAAVAPADTLEGTFTIAGSGFIDNGFGSFTDVTAGSSITAGTISFDPTSIGTFTETITLDPSGFDPSLSGTLTPETMVVKADVACFAAGTRIATPRGEVAIEELREGDLVLTASGSAQPIVWIGHSVVDCRRHARPEDVIPVRIRAGAFAEGLPARDLVLSPGHAVFAEGVLIPAVNLVNGLSIVREEAVGRITYYHLELPAHGVVLAESLPTESYLDDGNRAAFDNGGLPRMLHPDYRPQSWENACAPMRERGPEVAALKRRLRARLKQLGFRRDTQRGVQVFAGGKRLRSRFARGGLRHVVVPAGVTELRIVSPRGVPAGLCDDSADTRWLGAQLALVLLDGEWIPLDSPVLAGGFHGVEQDASGSWRWTNGEAILELPPPNPGEAADAPRLLEIFVRDVMHGWALPKQASLLRAA